jgi:hypothetical protein
MYFVSAASPWSTAALNASLFAGRTSRDQEFGNLGVSGRPLLRGLTASISGVKP